MIHSLKPITGGRSLALLKRLSFRHEEELRVVTVPPDILAEDYPPSDSLSVDVVRLISEIYLSPAAPEWLLGTVQSLLQQLDLEEIRVVQSDLYDRDIR